MVLERLNLDCLMPDWMVTTMKFVSCRYQETFLQCRIKFAMKQYHLMKISKIFAILDNIFDLIPFDRVQFTAMQTMSCLLFQSLNVLSTLFQIVNVACAFDIYTYISKKMADISLMLWYIGKRCQMFLQSTNILSYFSYISDNASKVFAKASYQHCHEEVNKAYPVGVSLCSVIQPSVHFCQSSFFYRANYS